MPSDEDLYAMSKQMGPDTVKLINKIDNIPRKDFMTIMPKDSYTTREKELAADLIEKLLFWNPQERLTCEQALKHDYFRKK